MHTKLIDDGTSKVNASRAKSNLDKGEMRMGLEQAHENSLSLGFWASSPRHKGRLKPLGENCLDFCFLF